MNEIMPLYTTGGFLRQQQTPGADIVRKKHGPIASANYSCYQGIHVILLTIGPQMRPRLINRLRTPAT
jgi:hypothetical protein